MRAVRTVVAVLAGLTVIAGCGSAGGQQAAKPANKPANRVGDTGASRQGTPGSSESGATTLPGGPVSRRARQGPGRGVASRTAPQERPEAGSEAGSASGSRTASGSGSLPPVVYRVPTRQRVVFLGIDDGVTKDPAFLALIQRLHIPFSAFLTDNEIRSNYGFFRRLQQAGVTIEDHTLTHPQLTHRSLAAQKREICGAADRYARVFGRRPVLLRPPYGSFNLDTRRAAKACGMRALVNWDVSLPGTKLRFAYGSKLRPGDIILTHFRPKLLRDLRPVLAQIAREGFTIGRLEDYL